jgi:hypothetical protein
MPVGLHSEEEEFGFLINLSNPVGTSSNGSVVISSVLISFTVSVGSNSSVTGLPFVFWCGPSNDSIDVHN